MLGDGPVSLPPQAVQMQGVRAYDSFYVSREEERRHERARERERDLRRQKEAAPKQVRHCAVSACRELCAPNSPLQSSASS